MEKDALHMRMKHKAAVNGNGYAAPGKNGSPPAIVEEQEERPEIKRTGSGRRKTPLPHYDAEGE